MKTKLRYLLKSIQKNKGSFLNVALIAAVGMAVLLGILSTAQSIQLQANQYFIDNKLQSAEIKCANGITQEDIDVLLQQENIDMAEGGYAAKVVMEKENEKLLLHALSLTEQINIPVIVEGILPQGKTEVAIEQKFADREGIKVGDIINLDQDGSFYENSFTVTAIINHPAYCCLMGKETRGSSTIGNGVVSYYIMMAPEAFNPHYYGNAYSVVRVRNNKLDAYYYYSEEYAKQETLFIDSLEKLGEERSKLRYENLLTLAPTSVKVTDDPWVVSNRETSGDLRGIPLLVDTLKSISYSLSVLFMLVVIVVCYTAISRMIEEQKSLVGMQKAQGFQPREIMGHYMAYNFLCAITGIAMGWIISIFGMEKAVLTMLNTRFLVGSCSLTFVWKEGLIVAGICIITFLATCYLTCRKTIQEPVSQLIGGSKFAKQNKKFPFENRTYFRKLNLFSRIMIKNVLGDKKRLITTIIGVLGSVTLMIVCLSLKMAIDNAFEKQFSEYYHYENRLTVDTRRGTVEDFQKTLDERKISHLNIQDKLRNYKAKDGRWTSAHLLVLEETPNLQEFIRLEDAHTGQKLTVPQDGILVSRKCAEVNHFKAGDMVEIIDESGKIRYCRIAGIMEHYISFTYFVTSPEYYESVFGQKTDPCVFLLHGNTEGLLDEVKDLPGFLALRNNSDYKEDTSIIYAVIAICLVLSASLTFLVILNQIVMYINRKAVELAVMRVNGYDIKKTKSYIYRDNVVLTGLGLLFGNLFGSGLSILMIRIMEREIHHYVRYPDWRACLYASLITVLFVILVNLIGLRKIHSLNLTNVNSN